MKNRNMVIVIFIVLLFVLFYKMKDPPTEETFLFPKDEITHTNIERIEVHKFGSSKSIFLDDVVGIEMISSFLMKMNSGNLLIDDGNSNKPIYLIYISNIGHYPHIAIGVYKDSIYYNGKKTRMTSEESASLFKFFDVEFRKLGG